MSASFQESQFQANTIEDSILYVENVQRMEFVSAWEQYSQVNPDDSLEDRNDSIYFFRFQSNLIVYILDKIIVKATLQPLKFNLELLQYILSTDTKMGNVWNHPSYQYQRRILFNSLEEVNRITQYYPWNTQIYSIQIILSEKTMMKTPETETKTTTQYETQQQQQPQKITPPDEAIL